MSARRVVIRMCASMCRLMWGFPPRMIPEIVNSMGTARALAWFMANMPRYLWTLLLLGPVRTHLAVVVISLYNGCTYCTFGHAYALELLYLREHGRLFPLDAPTISSWIGLTRRDLDVRLRTVLERAGLHQEAVWAGLVLALVDGELQPVDVDELRLMRLARIVGLMNTVSIASGVEPDEAHDSVNKDTALKQRHQALRAQGPRSGDSGLT